MTCAWARGVVTIRRIAKPSHASLVQRRTLRDARYENANASATAPTGRSCASSTHRSAIARLRQLHRRSACVPTVLQRRTCSRKHPASKRDVCRPPRHHPCAPIDELLRMLRNIARRSRSAAKRALPNEPADASRTLCRNARTSYPPGTTGNARAGADAHDVADMFIETSNCGRRCSMKLLQCPWSRKVHKLPDAIAERSREPGSRRWASIVATMSCSGSSFISE